MTILSASTPSLSDTIKSVSSGAINADFLTSIPELGSMSELSGALPAPMASALTGASSSVLGELKSAQSNLPTLISVTSASANLVNMKAANEGREPTDEEIAAACRPLAIFTEGPAKIAELLSGIYDSLRSSAKSFGIDVSSFGSDALAMAKAVGSAIKSATNQLVSLTSAVASAVGDAAKAVAQAALDAYKTANALLVSAFDDISAKVGQMVGSFTAGISSLASEASAAFKSAIADLKAFATGINFSLPSSTPCLSKAKDLALDVSKLTNTAGIKAAISAPPMPAVFG